VKKPTLKMVAEKLGVSKATVSNAFNRPDQLSGKLREHILNECQALGYTGPSITARSLRTGTTGIVGVLLADCLAYNFSDPVASLFLEGVASTLDKQNVNLLLLPVCAENYRNTQVETIPDSYIVYGKPSDMRILERLNRQGKPLVTVDFDARIAHGVSVNVNNRQAAKKAALHAIRNADDKVAILGLRLANNDQIGVADIEQLFEFDESISRRRLEGYRDALAERQIELKDDAIWHIPQHDPLPVQVMVRGLLSAPERPNVLLCMSDKIAISALQAAQDLKLRVPNELHIVGFDDIPEAQQVGLTTIQQPLFDKGRIAAEILLQQRPFESIELSADLVVRNSA